MGHISSKKALFGYSTEDRLQPWLSFKTSGNAVSLQIGQLAIQVGGRRQRVFIASSFMFKIQKLSYLDEPTASIDAKGQPRFIMLLSQVLWQSI